MGRDVSRFTDRKLADRPFLAGAIAGVTWRAVEPGLRRIFGHPYSDPELATAFVTRGPLQPLLDYCVQAIGGGTFAVVFTRFGGRSAPAALAATMAENALLLAASPLVDRLHPDVRDGTWPPLAGNARAAGVSVSGHALYALLLAALLRT
jgi:hypothetical protein